MKSGDLALWRYMGHEILVLILARVFPAGSRSECEYWEVFGQLYSNSEAAVYFAAGHELTEI